MVGMRSRNIFREIVHGVCEAPGISQELYQITAPLGWSHMVRQRTLTTIADYVVLSETGAACFAVFLVCFAFFAAGAFLAGLALLADFAGLAV